MLNFPYKSIEKNPNSVYCRLHIKREKENETSISDFAPIKTTGLPSILVRVGWLRFESRGLASHRFELTLVLYSTSPGLICILQSDATETKTIAGSKEQQQQQQLQEA